MWVLDVHLVARLLLLGKHTAAVAMCLLTPYSMGLNQCPVLTNYNSAVRGKLWVQVIKEQSPLALEKKRIRNIWSFVSSYLGEERGENGERWRERVRKKGRVR